MTTNENGLVEYHSDRNIGTIEFYHPKGNSLPGNLLNDLANTIRTVASNPINQVLILKSRGEGAFCGGASIDELQRISNEEDGKAYFMGFANVINAMRTSPQTIITRVHGKTVGGGIGIIAASDFVVASKRAAIRLSEISLGIGPFIVGPALVRKMGISAFSTLAYDAKTWYHAEWAYEKGLYNKLADSTEELDSETERMANSLAESNPEALRRMKEFNWQSSGHWDSTLEQRAEITAKLAVSPYARQAIETFQIG